MSTFLHQYQLHQRTNLVVLHSSNWACRHYICSIIDSLQCDGTIFAANTHKNAQMQPAFVSYIAKHPKHLLQTIFSFLSIWDDILIASQRLGRLLMEACSLPSSKICMDSCSMKCACTLMYNYWRVFLFSFETDMDLNNSKYNALSQTEADNHNVQCKQLNTVTAKRGQIFLYSLSQ